MKLSKSTHLPKPATSSKPGAAGKQAETAAPSTGTGPVKSPGPHQITTEEAVEVWRNEGDPN